MIDTIDARNRLVNSITSTLQIKTHIDYQFDAVQEPKLPLKLIRLTIHLFVENYVK